MWRRRKSEAATNANKNPKKCKEQDGDRRGDRVEASKLTYVGLLSDTRFSVAHNAQTLCCQIRYRGVGIGQAGQAVA